MGYPEAVSSRFSRELGGFSFGAAIGSHLGMPGCVGAQAILDARRWRCIWADPLTSGDVTGYRRGVKAANPSYVRTPRLTRLEYEGLVERGVVDYWIANLLGNVLEVYRDPERTAAGRWRYATVRVVKPRALVSPLAAPRARLRVAELLA